MSKVLLDFRRRKEVGVPLWDSILVFISVPDEMFPMRVFSSEPVASVKLRIQDRRGIVARQQRLIFDGRELSRDDNPIRDYGVVDGDVLYVLIRFTEVREIRVTTACGKTFDLRVNRKQDVRYLRSEVSRKAEGVLDLCDHQLLCAGVKLDDSLFVDDIGGVDDKVIHLLAKKSVEVVDHGLELLVKCRDPARKPLLEPIVTNPKVGLCPQLKKLVRSTSAGLNGGNSPVRSKDGSGGAYFMRNESGTGYVAVFKPTDEEAMAVNNPQGLPPSPNGEGLKRGTRVGEGALREVAAYLLDHPLGRRRSSTRDGQIGFSGVPPTVMVRCLHPGFNHPKGFEFKEENYKVGSLQMFVNNDGSCEDLGPMLFPVNEVHKISVLDMRLANADRHAGNVLVQRDREDGTITLVPIDHGYCLPENFEDCTFEWLNWPQAMEAYEPKTVEYVKSLDAEEDIALLKFYGWELSVECARTLRISTMLLKKGVERGLSPFTIGKLFCRETINKKSEIEEIVNEAKATLLPVSNEVAFMDSISEIMDRRLDELTP